jgi:hypothetical protein
MNRWLARLGAVATAVAATGCGGGAEEEQVPASVWARSVCAAVVPWTAEVERLQGEARRRISAKSDVEQSKAELVRLFGAMELASDSAVQRVKGAGVPEVRDGGRIAAQFVRALVAARDSFGAGMSAVQRLPTVDEAAFHDGVVAAGHTMSRENGTASQAFASVSSPELDDAFAEIPECR